MSMEMLDFLLLVAVLIIGCTAIYYKLKCDDLTGEKSHLRKRLDNALLTRDRYFDKYQAAAEQRDKLAGMLVEDEIDTILGEIEEA